MAHICLITPGHLASTPRLVREADALAEAGHKVHVVYGRHFPPADSLDEPLIARASWKPHPVRLTGTWTARLAALKHKIALRSPARTWKEAALICHAHVQALAAAASEIAADAYHGHCLGGLGAAALAAEAKGIPWGFDIEDFHETETERFLKDKHLREAASLLQRTLLSKSSVLTSSSEAIAHRCENTYGVSSLVLHNVYPLCEAPPDFKPADAVPPARLYWFSQTIGPGRGLEEAVAVLGRMHTPAELTLRGFVSPDYRASLEKKATDCGLRYPLVFFPPGDPDRMPLLSAGYHLGLSLERRVPDNRNICLTNKIFAYLAAGVPVWLSETEAQKNLAKILGSACILADPDDAGTSAAVLDAFFASPRQLNEASQKAWDLGRTRYCWDHEKREFLEAWNRCLP